MEAGDKKWGLITNIAQWVMNVHSKAPRASIQLSILPQSASMVYWHGTDNAWVG